MRTWPAAANDDFSDPPGMDARRARSDRDVARARGQKNRVSKGLRATKREAGRLCAPAQSAFPPSMAVRSKRPTGVRGKTPQRGHRAGRQLKKPARAAATQSTQRLQFRTQPPPAHFHAERGSERSTGRAAAHKASPRSGYSSTAPHHHFML